MAIDLSFWGESDGEPKNAISPDMFSESFNAAVDFLGTRPFVDRENIGVLGVCGSGGFVISAAKIDPRMKAIATISMYDMGSVTRNGYGKSRTVEQRKELIAQAAQQRYEEYTTGKQIFMNYLPVELPENADPVTRMYHGFYRTDRGIHIPKGRTLETTQNRTLVGEMKFNNFYPFVDIETISPRPLLFIAGDKAHSKEFSEDAYQKAAQPKELYYVKDADHVDLYDNVTGKAPFDKLETFFKEHLK
ncbi:alpha/beta hydrolase [Chryseobacterium sp. SIMBA_029]|uniref:alpha/beta hydrolase n=1 Tax=Chryseobacterium sp. SIMBA_029 TaxID=3085772 RepID=UPI0039786596